MVIRLLKSIFPKWYRKQMLISSSIHPFIEGKRRHTKINNARQLHPSISIPLFHFPTSGSLIGSSCSPNNIYSHFFFPAGIQFLYFFGRLLVFNFTSLSTGNRKNGRENWNGARHVTFHACVTMLTWRQQYGMASADGRRNEMSLGWDPHLCGRLFSHVTLGFGCELMWLGHVKWQRWPFRFVANSNGPDCTATNDHQPFH